MNKQLYKAFGVQIRLLAGAICFGIWQHNVYAGVFAYVFLVTVEVVDDE